MKKLTGEWAGTNGRVKDDYFGVSVSVSGDVIVVGANVHDYDSAGVNQVTDAGAAYVFRRNQGGADNWGFVKKLTGEWAGTNGRAEIDNFGGSVSVSGDVIIVGALTQDYDSAGGNQVTNAGAAYVFSNKKSIPTGVTIVAKENILIGQHQNTITITGKLSKGTAITITDLLGRECYHSTITDNTALHTITRDELSNAAVGCYIVTINQQGAVQHGKVIFK